MLHRSATRSLGLPAVALGVFALLSGSLASADVITAMPDNDPRSGRFLNIVRGMSSLGEQGVSITIAVPAANPAFDVSIFDGDMSAKWDQWYPYNFSNPGDPCTFSLYADPTASGVGAPANLVAAWDGALMPDDGWATNTVVNVPGAYNASLNKHVYCLIVTWQGTKYAHEQNNFKLAVTNGEVFLLTHSTFSFMGYGPNDPVSVFFPATSYDGGWHFLLEVPAGAPSIDLWDGDFDRATDTYCFSSDPVVNMEVWDLLFSTAGLPPFPSPSAVPEGVNPGDPPDDNGADPRFKVDPPIFFDLTSPVYPEPITGNPTRWTVRNDNPSGDEEWEFTRISTLPGTGVRSIVPAIPSGFYRWDIGGADGRNTLFIRPTYPMYGAARLGDYVWLDENWDGIQDPGESGVPGVVVNLIGSANTVLDTTTTDASGFYLFDGLGPGSYRVQFVLPAGYSVSPQLQGADPLVDSNPDPLTGLTAPVTLLAGQSDMSIDAGIYQPASIGDFVWYDANADGIQDAGESGAPNVPASLLDGNGDVIATTTTDANGYYSFDGLMAGTYSVKFDLPTGYLVSPMGAGGQANSSWVDVNGLTLPVTLAAGEIYPHDDAGIFQLVAIGDRVWLDNDGDGVQDAGEPGINGVTVNLYDAAMTLLGSATTAGDGIYMFLDLMPGVPYTVTVDASTLPAGLTQTYDLDGLATPHTATVPPLTATRLDVDFGYKPQGNGATRTIGYWATHLKALQAAVDAGVINLGKLLYPVNGSQDLTNPSIGDVEAIMWGDIAKVSKKDKRSPLGQARMQLGQQLVAAMANLYFLGTDPLSKGYDAHLLSDAVAALDSMDVELIKSFIGKVDGFNNSGDNIELTGPQASIIGPADPKASKAAANTIAGTIYPGPAFE